MRFDIITIFPHIFDSYFKESILARAQKNKLIKIQVHDLRRWTEDKHKTVDDRPYGGGPGMILMVEPIFRAVTALKKLKVSARGGPAIGGKTKKTRIILFSAKGKKFSQKDARRLNKYGQLILICGRYEGVDERVARHVADEEISVGDYVLTGGEIPAMIVVDAVSRLIPGVLGKKESLKEESFSIENCKLSRRSGIPPEAGKIENYLEYPQYTRPENFKGWKVPKVLLSGNHKKIEEWRKTKSKKRIV